jgi:hypothetical protein
MDTFRGAGRHLAIYQSNAATSLAQVFGTCVSPRYRSPSTREINRSCASAGIGGGNTVCQGPLFKPECRDTWAQYGLAGERAARESVDGARMVHVCCGRRPMELVIGRPARDGQSDILELVGGRGSSWASSRQASQRGVAQRVFAATLISIWLPGDGIVTADMSRVRPTSQQQLQWRSGKHTS